MPGSSLVSIGFEKMRLKSSGSKIYIQLLMFFVIGVLPIIFPQWINIENKLLLFVIVSMALVVSLIYELLKRILEKKGRETTSLQCAQLLTSVIFLTLFLHFFGYINGPFFILYLLALMESFLNLSTSFSYFLIGLMIFSTSFEFVWLVVVNKISFSFVPVIEFIIRIFSILFISGYGFVLAKKMTDEKENKKSVQEYANNLRQSSGKLEELNKKLVDLDRQKDEFISMAAHELRAPMTAVKGYISMVMEGDAGDISEKARGFLADANAINDRLIRLVNNMLNVSRIEKGKMVFQYEDEELSHVVRSVYSVFLPEAERKGISYKLNLPKNIKDKVHVDVDKLHEVIANLISNAVKYTDTGSVEIELKQTKKGWVRFEVKDTGPGISSKEQKKLFHKFYRVESNVGKTTGTGLGLYISKLLVNEFKGEIGLDSEVGKGSTFWFELPIVKADDTK